MCVYFMSGHNTHINFLVYMRVDMSTKIWMGTNVTLGGKRLGREWRRAEKG